MIDNARLDELFAAARRAAPETSRLEYAFETRLLARLREQRESSVQTWAWRLSPFFAAVAVALTLWSRTARELPGETPLFAQIAEEHDSLSYLAGGL
jgi:anti-sigma-K factor RskA